MKRMTTRSNMSLTIPGFGIAALVCVLGNLANIQAEDPAVTFKSLLQDMTDRDRLASWPKVEYRCSAFTSYDRSHVAPDKPGWFGNRDYGQFVRIETNDNRQECVLMDAAGPGAVVFLHNAAEYRGTIRIYFDNNPKPAIEAATKDLIGGKHLADKPFSYNLPEIPLIGEESWLARNLWLPLPYAKHCKVTWDGNPKGMFYYNGLYLTFAPATKVETFTMEQLKTYADDIIAAGNRLMTHQLPVKGTVTKANVTVPAETTNVIFTKADGPGAVRRMRMSVQADDYQQALRSTILEISFDGEPCVWCPIGDFFGTGYDIYPHTTWYTRVDQQAGTMECLWTMPFARSVEVRLRNLGNRRSRPRRKWTVATGRGTSARCTSTPRGGKPRNTAGRRWTTTTSRFAAAACTWATVWTCLLANCRARSAGGAKATRRSTWTARHSPRISAPARKIITATPGAGPTSLKCRGTPCHAGEETNVPGVP